MNYGGSGIERRNIHWIDKDSNIGGPLTLSFNHFLVFGGKMVIGTYDGNIIQYDYIKNKYEKIFYHVGGADHLATLRWSSKNREIKLDYYSHNAGRLIGVKIDIIKNKILSEGPLAVKSSGYQWGEAPSLFDKNGKYYFIQDNSFKNSENAVHRVEQLSKLLGTAISMLADGNFLKVIVGPIDSSKGANEMLQKLKLDASHQPLVLRADLRPLEDDIFVGAGNFWIKKGHQFVPLMAIAGRIQLAELFENQIYFIKQELYFQYPSDEMFDSHCNKWRPKVSSIAIFKLDLSSKKIIRLTVGFGSVRSIDRTAKSVTFSCDIAGQGSRLFKADYSDETPMIREQPMSPTQQQDVGTVMKWNTLGLAKKLRSGILVKRMGPTSKYSLALNIYGGAYHSSAVFQVANGKTNWVLPFYDNFW